MNLRGKEVYVITGVIVVVVAVAWFFLLFKPLMNNVSAADAQLTQITTDLQTAKTVELPKLQSYEKTAPQMQSDLLRLNKMMPGAQGIPSVMVEIEQTAEQSGLDFLSISPGGVAIGSPFGLEPISLTFAGTYYDLEDFLFRLESYVEYRNNAFLVTGRLLQVSSVELPAVHPIERKFKLQPRFVPQPPRPGKPLVQRRPRKSASSPSSRTLPPAKDTGKE